MNKLKAFILGLIPRAILNLYALKPLQLIGEVLDSKAKVSYSQQGEDLAILKYFGRRWGGTYVDIGAFHPVKYSNTLSFHKMGWTGINVEPNPDNFKLFEQLRSKDINLNVAVGRSNEKLKYYSFNNAAVNTFNVENAKQWAAQPGFKILSEFDVEIVPLSEILKKNLNGRAIDFMSIDVEGMDLEVLKSNDWSLFRPRMILVEDNILGYASYKDCPIYTYMVEQGYYLSAIYGVTMIFIENGF